MLTVIDTLDIFSQVVLKRVADQTALRIATAISYKDEHLQKRL